MSATLTFDINKVKYINISERLPEAESINEVRRAFSAVHIYITTDPKKDLEILRKHFTSWKETNSDGQLFSNGEENVILRCP